jgi:hypothetical protein
LNFGKGRRFISSSSKQPDLLWSPPTLLFIGYWGFLSSGLNWPRHVADLCSSKGLPQVTEQLRWKFLMPVLSSELWTAIGVNKHVTKQITNTIQVTVNAGSAVCCYANIPGLPIKSLHFFCRISFSEI